MLPIDGFLGTLMPSGPGGFQDISARRDHVVFIGGDTAVAVTVEAQYNPETWRLLYKGPVTPWPVIVPRGATLVRCTANAPGPTFAIYRGALKPPDGGCHGR